MASRLGHQLARAAQVCRRQSAIPTRSSPLTQLRSFHVSPPSFAGRSEELISDDDALDLFDDTFEDDDTAAAGHMMLREQRQTLYYLRLIEHEMPKLVAFRKPFQPQNSDALIVRSLDYGGEDHPAIKKRVVVVAVDSLPLRDQDAVHKFKLLAGPRWTLRPPADAGVSGIAGWGNGFVKISCEDFPQPTQNLKWISDTLDKLIEEANNSKEKFTDIPLDIRHIYAKARKDKKGEHLRGRIYGRPTIHDFPQEWLPDSAPSNTHS
ncbi:37S ribosomal protein S24, mitochondrial [Marasmius tenuissimus]|uniref:37S ribosomal protein S24, mitochondrial n=1 Tax=Marasmius tenuissimus TaxID=585030 RepID=A0ABR3AH59_9AGAR